MPVKGLAALNLPAQQRWRRSLSSGQGHQACGWIFRCRYRVFDTIGLLPNGRVSQPVGRSERRYARIQEGLVRINRGAMTCIPKHKLSRRPDSRVELSQAAETGWNTLQTALVENFV